MSRYCQNLGNAVDRVDLARTVGEPRLSGGAAAVTITRGGDPDRKAPGDHDVAADRLALVEDGVVVLDLDGVLPAATSMPDAPFDQVAPSFWQTPFASAVGIVVHRLLGAALLVVVAPLMLAIAVAVAISSKGPVFYRQRRYGQDGETFDCFKFRTMVVDADAVLARLLDDADTRAAWLQNAKLENDPRITKVGAFLRLTSLDELPQLFNVVLGHMNLVGPRPLAHEHELRWYGDRRAELLAVRPGMTGLWQVNGRSELSMPERVVFDLDYVRRRGPIIDLQILLRTSVILLAPWRSGAR